MASSLAPITTDGGTQVPHPEQRWPLGLQTAEAMPRRRRTSHLTSRRRSRQGLGAQRPRLLPPGKGKGKRHFFPPTDNDGKGTCEPLQFKGKGKDGTGKFGQGRANHDSHQWDCWTCGSPQHLQAECPARMAPVIRGCTLTCVRRQQVRAPRFLFWLEDSGGYRCVRYSTCDGS